MDLFPQSLSFLEVSGLLAASFAGSLITISFGLGGGILLLGIMASLLPPAVLIPIHGIVQLGSNAGRAIVMAKHIRWPIIIPFALGSILGVAVGGHISTGLSPAFVQLIVGLFILWSVFQRAPRWLTRSPALAGALTSFLTMFFGATGPFVATFTKAQSLSRKAYAGTHAALMVSQHLFKTIAFGFLGVSFGPWAILCLGMIAAGLAGTLVGKRILDRMKDRQFGTVLNVILVLVALRLIWLGAMAYWPNVFGI